MRTSSPTTILWVDTGLFPPYVIPRSPSGLAVWPSDPPSQLKPTPSLSITRLLGPLMARLTRRVTGCSLRVKAAGFKRRSEEATS